MGGLHRHVVRRFKHEDLTYVIKELPGEGPLITRLLDYSLTYRALLSGRGLQIPYLGERLLDALEPATLYHQLLEHRWFLSEAAGRDVGMPEAVESYLTTVLAEAPRRTTGRRRHHVVTGVGCDQFRIGSTVTVRCRLVVGRRGVRASGVGFGWRRGG